MGPHVNSSHSGAVRHPGLLTLVVLVGLLSVSIVPACCLMLRGVGVLGSGAVARRVIGVGLWIQKDAVALRQLAAALRFVAGDAFGFGIEVGRVGGAR